MKLKSTRQRGGTLSIPVNVHTLIKNITDETGGIDTLLGNFKSEDLLHISNLNPSTVLPSLYTPGMRTFVSETLNAFLTWFFNHGNQGNSIVANLLVYVNRGIPVNFSADAIAVFKTIPGLEYLTYIANSAYMNIDGILFTVLIYVTLGVLVYFYLYFARHQKKPSKNDIQVIEPNTNLAIATQDEMIDKILTSDHQINDPLTGEKNLGYELKNKFPKLNLGKYTKTLENIDTLGNQDESKLNEAKRESIKPGFHDWMENNYTYIKFPTKHYNTVNRQW